MATPRLCVIIRDDDTCALTPPALLETVYGPLWERNFPVTLATVPAILGSHNLNVPLAERGSGKQYRFERAAPITTFLKKQQLSGKIEIAQHGFAHTTDLTLRFPKFGATEGYDRALLTRASEFYGRCADDTASFVREGRALLEDHFGPMTSFVAPQEYLTPILLRALRAEGFHAYSGGIRPTFWKQTGPLVKPVALARLVTATLQRTDPAFLGEYVTQLTDLPIIPATYRHYWSGFRTDEEAAETLRRAKAIFKQKYDKGGGYFLLLTHYWEYFGDWEGKVTQPRQLESLHQFTKYMDSFADIAKLTLSQYVATLRS